MTVRIPMTPRGAIQKSLSEAAAQYVPNLDHISGLTHALECMHDMSELLRYIRSALPTREPELMKMITRQLSKGCDL